MIQKEFPPKRDMVIPRNFVSHLLDNKDESKYFLRHDLGITDENRKQVVFPDFIFLCRLSDDQFQWRYDPRGVNNQEQAFKKVFGEYYGNLPHTLGVNSFLTYESVGSKEKEESKSYISLQNIPECILCFATCKVKNGSDHIEQVIHFFHASYLEPHKAYVQTHVTAYEHPPKAGK